MTVGKSKFHAVGLMVSLEDGISKAHVRKMLDLMPDDEDFRVISIAENTSQILGFITVAAAEQHEKEVELLMQQLCDEWKNEQEGKVYTTPNGLLVYIDCDCETIIVPPLVTCQSFGCINGYVDGEKCDTCGGSGLVSDGEPGSESYHINEEDGVFSPEKNRDTFNVITKTEKSNEQVKIAETIADISIVAGCMIAQNEISVEDSRELISNISIWANEFENKWGEADSQNEDYIGAIDNFAKFKLLYYYGSNEQDSKVEHVIVEKLLEQGN